ncbi:MAG: glycoside hydrolase family 13 protein, partial [Clostridia bacterium]|nr:glycoside hydrolase family 13 protein [Clostridia bacterium]
MQKIVFDSKSTNFKKPFGAVSTNENTEFNIYIKKDEAFSEMFFVYRNDGSENSTYILMHKTGENDSYYIFSCVVKFDKPDLYFYRFELKCNGISKFIGNKNGQAVIEDWLPEWQLTVYDAGFKTPDWVKGGIMYQIFPDRFCKSEDFSPFPSKNERKIHESWNDIPEFIYDNPNYNANDFFCGNLKGVLEKLDYIKSFGVNIIYFNPIFESPENHRYSTGYYFILDPYFGKNEQFKEFIKLCDQKG